MADARKRIDITSGPVADADNKRRTNQPTRRYADAPKTQNPGNKHHELKADKNSFEKTEAARPKGR